MIISDLAADCIQHNVEEYALSRACSDIRREASAEKPFPPPTGEILRRAIACMRVAKELSGPHAPARLAPAISKNAVPWFGKAWGEFTDQDKQGLVAHLAGMEPTRREDYLKYLHNYVGIPKDASF